MYIKRLRFAGVFVLGMKKPKREASVMHSGIFIIRCIFGKAAWSGQNAVDVLHF